MGPLPNCCYQYLNDPGRQFLPLDNSTLLPGHPLSWVPGFAPLLLQVRIRNGYGSEGSRPFGCPRPGTGRRPGTRELPNSCSTGGYKRVFERSLQEPLSLRAPWWRLGNRPQFCNIVHALNSELKIQNSELPLMRAAFSILVDASLETTVMSSRGRYSLMVRSKSTFTDGGNS